MPSAEPTGIAMLSTEDRKSTRLNSSHSQISDARFCLKKQPGHVSVLTGEVLALLAPQPGMRVIDATFGGGGHSRALLAASAPDGHVLVLNADPDAIAR